MSNFYILLSKGSYFNDKIWSNGEISLSVFKFHLKKMRIVWQTWKNIWYSFGSLNVNFLDTLTACLSETILHALFIAELDIISKFSRIYINSELLVAYKPMSFQTSTCYGKYSSQPNCLRLFHSLDSQCVMKWQKQFTIILFIICNILNLNYFFRCIKIFIELLSRNKRLNVQVGSTKSII